MHQKQKTRHAKSNVHPIRPTTPAPGERIRLHHRVQRRIYGAPLWFRLLGIVGIACLLVGLGYVRGEGRSSVYAEQLAEANTRAEELSTQVVDLKTELAAAPTTDVVDGLKKDVAGLEKDLFSVRGELAAAPTEADVKELNDDLTELQAQLDEKVKEIEGWAGRVEVLEAQAGRDSQSIATQAEMVDIQANRANRLQAEETARIAALPGLIVDNLSASPPYASGNYRIAISQSTIAEAFGQRVFGWLDELKSVTARGNAVFIAEGTYSADNAGEVTEVMIPLPAKVSHGLFEFTLNSFEYDPGWLATVNDQDVSELMVWTENEYLVPMVCADVSTLHSVIANAEAQVQSVAGEREVEVVWVSQSGQEFSTDQLTDSVLLANVC